MDALYALARRHGLRVIEDAALAIGSQWQGRNIGALRRPRHVQLPSEQEHDHDRGRRARRQRRRRGGARRGAALPRHRATCPTARATSRSPAASSTCPTSTRASASRSSRGCRSSCATRRALVARYFERFATDPPCVLPPRPRAGDGQSWNMFAPAAAARPADDHAQAVQRRAATRAASAPAYRTRRCTCRTLGRRYGYQRGRFPGAERIARETRDAAAVPGDDRRRRRPRLRAPCAEIVAGARDVTPTGGRRSDDARPQLSVVIPVYNEEAGLPALFARLYPALDALGVALRGHLRQRRQPRPLGGAAARAVRSAAPTSRASCCSTPTTASTWRSSPASSTAAASASSRSTPTCRTRPRKSRKLLAAMDAGHDYVGGVRAHARGLVVAALRLARDEPAARAHHAHPDDRPGLHAARLQPRDRRRGGREPRGQHLHPGARLHVRAATRPRSRSRTRSAPPASRKYSLYKLIRLNFDLITGFSLVPLQLFSMFGMFVVGGCRSPPTSSSSATGWSSPAMARAWPTCSGTATSSRSS